MPNLDGTGPDGKGRPGRGMGYRRGYNGEGRRNGGRGRGQRGIGYGDRSATPLAESTWLENQINALRSALQELTSRIDSLKKE